MSEDGFDWHNSDLAKTNPNVEPPELPTLLNGHAVAGEVEGKTEAPELVEISTVRVLGDLVEKLEPPSPDAAAAETPAEGVGLDPPDDDPLAPARSARVRAAPVLVAAALLLLAAAAWALVGS